MTDFNPHDNKTSDGVVITLGMWVRDYDYQIGKVVADRTSNIMHDSGYCHEDHWFEVERIGGQTKDFNGERMVSRPTPVKS